MRLFGRFLFLFMAAACSSVPTSTPTPPPAEGYLPTLEPSLELYQPSQDFPGHVNGFADYSEDTLIYLLSSETWICLFLQESPFWEPGDDWRTFEDLPKTVLKLDQNVMTELRRFMRGVVRWEYDENGEVIGMHGDSMDYCLLPKNIAEGLHTVTTQVTTTSGKVYTYKWDFKAIQRHK